MENFKLIPLGKSGKFAIVDEEDYEWLSQWKWHINGKGYAVRHDNQNGEYVTSKSGKKYKKSKSIRMHREINNTPEGFDTDHINRQRLDNRRANLRSATRSENVRNTPAPKTNKSGHKGICWYKQTSKWLVTATVQGVKQHIGYFEKIEDAITARKNWELSQSTTEP